MAPRITLHSTSYLNATRDSSRTHRTDSTDRQHTLQCLKNFAASPYACTAP